MKAMQNLLTAGLLIVLMALLLPAITVAGERAHRQSLIACSPDYCKNVTCTPVDPEQCDGEVKVKGSVCGCCDLCVVELEEGDPCVMQVGMGGPPPKVKCGPGLRCVASENGATVCESAT